MELNPRLHHQVDMSTGEGVLAVDVRPPSSEEMPGKTAKSTLRSNYPKLLNKWINTKNYCAAVLKEALETRGALGEIKARIRAEVFAALDDQSEAKPPIKTGLSTTPLDREFLRNELNVVEDAPSRTVPLLYSLVSHYKDGNAERANRNFIQPEKDFGSRYTASTKENGTREPSAVIVKGGKL